MPLRVPSDFFQQAASIIFWWIAGITAAAMLILGVATYLAWRYVWPWLVQVAQ